MRLISENNIVAGNVQVLVNNSNFLYNVGNGNMDGDDDSKSTYPEDNVLDLHPKKVAKANSNDTVFSFDMTVPSNAITIFNTNAHLAIVEILDENGNELSFSPIIVSLKQARTYEELITDRNRGDLSEFGIIYDKYYKPHVINIYLSHPDSGIDIEVGVAYIGVRDDFHEPDIGVVQTFKDYSLISELQRGATFILKRDIVRKFNFTMDFCLRSNDAERMKEIMLKVGPDPIPWWVTTANDEMWLVFARKDAEPAGTFYTYGRVKSVLNIIEVL